MENRVLFSSKHIVHKIALGATHCIALAEDILTQEKNVYTWGVSKLGGLGREVFIFLLLLLFFYYNVSKLLQLIIGN